MLKLFKLLFLLFLLDLKRVFYGVTGKIRYSYISWRAWWHGMIFQKVYEEKNSVACFLYTPILFYRIIEDTLMAWCGGETYKEYMRKKIEELHRRRERSLEKIEALRAETRAIETSNMSKFADLFPGATIHDFERFTKIRFFSLRLFIWLVKDAGKLLFGKMRSWLNR